MSKLSFDESGNLTPGVHWVAWDTLETAFGTSVWRKKLLLGLKRALDSLRSAGCQTVYIDGSFVTQKEKVFGSSPGDFDACWDWTGVNPTLLDPVLLDFENGRTAQKAKFFGELFPAQTRAHPDGTIFLDFFQQDKNTGQPKGIIALDLRLLP